MVWNSRRHCRHRRRCRRRHRCRRRLRRCRRSHRFLVVGVFDGLTTPDA